MSSLESMVRKGNVLPGQILTNSIGRCGLYGLSSPTTDYASQILRRGTVVKAVNLPVFKDGDRVANIAMP